MTSRKDIEEKEKLVSGLLNIPVSDQSEAIRYPIDCERRNLYRMKRDREYDLDAIYSVMIFAIFFFAIFLFSMF